ncbi:MAG TPA: N-acetyltransferase [Candidatus Marinimicrobia bacterium]|nr:N-acetyltransferase [Candidatus Neomarinimicrobiota bacterium]
MEHSTFISGKKILLRPYIADDALLFCRGENDPEVRETLFRAFPINVDRIHERIQSQIKAQNAVVFSIADKIRWAQGLGSEATRLMIEYGFNTLNLHRIQLHVFKNNHPAIRIYEKIGFKTERLLREAMYQHGEYCYFLLMGCLRDEWQAA